MFRMLLGIFLLALVPSAARPATYLVLPNGSGDYPTIQAAVNASSDGDVIELGSGTFTGMGNRDIDMASRIITIRSQSGDPADCVLNCQGVGRGFYFEEASPETRLEGITVTAGVADYGGGAYVLRPGDGPVFTDCIFDGNSVTEAGGGVAACGSPRFVRCVFIGNSAYYAGGGFIGSGMSNHDCSPVLDECRFVGNTAGSGGAIFLETTPIRNAVIQHCVFYGNSSVGSGAAIHLDGVDPLVDHCTFSYNAASVGGIVDCGWSSEAVITNCVIAFSTSGPPVSCQIPGSASLVCCDLYGNAGGDWVDCVAGQLGQSGNLCADPMFCDPDNGNFRLQSDSPCAPAQSPECGLMGACPIGCGPTPVTPISWGRLKVLFRD